MSKPGAVKIGVIGCGGIAGYHIFNIRMIPEARIDALADVDRSKIEGLISKFGWLSGCQIFDDYIDMLRAVDLDAVLILTPHTLHYEQAMNALEMGLHALIEKPMVCAKGEAERLVAKAEEKKRVVLVSYQRHYQPQFLYIRNMIESGELGDVQFISVLLCQDWLQFSRGTWRTDPALSGGGQLNDSGSHLIDIILWTTGLNAKEVFAFTENFDVPVDVNSSLSIRFDKGCLASISIVGNAPHWWEDIAISGTKGMILYRNGRLQHLSSEGRAVMEPLKLPPGSNPDRNFINAILNVEPNQSPPTCGLRVIELTEAAWKSAKTGELIKIPMR